MTDKQLAERLMQKNRTLRDRLDLVQQQATDTAENMKELRGDVVRHMEEEMKGQAEIRARQADIQDQLTAIGKALTIKGLT